MQQQLVEVPKMAPTDIGTHYLTRHATCILDEYETLIQNCSYWGEPKHLHACPM